ncbi:hypothetical protein IEQ34_008812 [Dendrobium chrysotoxum]|uniref:Uncharacterized protein n=1 Tax=Dendrobium chrysotoxum TaxID=161865 RepID=A0AAV7H0B8_DENCH|nr:hypothetical protein IEQ34_008812 [Dendrobium chrysotoxum]
MPAPALELDEVSVSESANTGDFRNEFTDPLDVGTGGRKDAFVDFTKAAGAKEFAVAEAFRGSPEGFVSESMRAVLKLPWFDDLSVFVTIKTV